MDAALAIILASFLVAEVLARLGRRQQHIRAWREAARALRLTGVRATNDLFAASLSGQVEGLRVVMEETRAGRRAGTRFVVSGLGGGDLFLRSEDLRTAMGKGLLGVEEIVVGDPEFDDRVYVQGADPTVVAILDAETRQDVARLLAGELEVGGEVVAVRAAVAAGVLTIEASERGAHQARFEDVLRAVVRLAHRLVAPRNVAQRLARNLLLDPQPGFRLNSLETLVREYPDDPVTQRTLLVSLRDASAEVRLRAASVLGEPGRETLRTLIASEGTDDSCAARAVTALGKAAGMDDLRVMLRRSLDAADRGETAIACLEALASRDDATSESAMRSALASARDDVRAAAARALGRVGTAAVVPDLRGLSQADSPVVRSAVRQAIAAIQSRLPGASPGQLSLAGGDAGALSLADEEAGQLSLAAEARAAFDTEAAGPAGPAAAPARGSSPPMRKEPA